MTTTLEGSTLAESEELEECSLDVLISCRMKTGSLYDLTRNARMI